jgi:transposase
VDEVRDEPLYRDRVCGIDIGKAQMVATIRVPSERDRARRAAETRSFGTTQDQVLALADWLRTWQVPAVVMEATGDYWKGPFYRLEAEGFECVLADARQVKHLPGRPKHDPGDSKWLAACFERGAITPCFVAAPEFRVIRLHTRYRRDLTEERTREKRRAEKRLARRRGNAKACVAVGNTQLKVYHALLSRPGTRYEDLGPNYYERQRDTRRQVAHHVSKLGALGFEVTLCRIPDPTPQGGGQAA